MVDLWNGGILHQQEDRISIKEGFIGKVDLQDRYSQEDDGY